MLVFAKDSILGNWPKKRAPKARGKLSAKRERERRRRESPPEAKGERSEPFAGGARDSANDDLQISGAILLQRPHKLG